MEEPARVLHIEDACKGLSELKVNRCLQISATEECGAKITHGCNRRY